MLVPMLRSLCIASPMVLESLVSVLISNLLINDFNHMKQFQNRSHEVTSSTAASVLTHSFKDASGLVD